MINRVDGMAHESEGAPDEAPADAPRDHAQHVETGIERRGGKAEQMIALINDRIVRKPGRR
jgi:hypothetical protein